MPTTQDLQRAAAVASAAAEEIAAAGDDPDADLAWSTKARLALQGLSLNYGDEGYAKLRSILSRAAGGELTYEQAVKEERDLIEEAREDFPVQSLALEFGGAIIPSIATTVVSGGLGLPAVVTNMGRLFAQFGFRQSAKKVAKTVAAGATEGAVAATGAGQGDLLDRTLDVDTAIGAGLGAVAAPAIQGVVKGATKVVGAVLNRDFVRKTLGSLSKAEDAEIQRVVDESDLTPDQIISRIVAGDTFPEISDTAAVNIRAMYTKAGKGREEIETRVRERAEKKFEDATAQLQKTLSPKNIAGNILQSFRKTKKQLREAEGAAYDAIFARGIGPSTELNDAILDVIQGQTFSRTAINKLLTARRQPPLFEIVYGQAKLLRDVDLETAEIVRRALDGQSTKAFKGGTSDLGVAYGKLEKELRVVIDGLSDDLAQTRANWSKIMRMADSFEDGTKIFGKSADEAEIIFNELVATGDMQAVEALRAGYASALRNKMQSGNRTTIFNKMSDVKAKERLILGHIYPGDDLDTAVRKIELAAQSANAKNAILGNSVTQKAQEAAKKIGTASNMANLGAFVASGGANIAAAARLLRDLVGQKMENLKPEQITEIAKTLTSEDPELLRRAINDESAYAIMSARANQLVDVLAPGVRRGTASTSAADVQRNESRALQGIIETLSPASVRKIREATRGGPQ